MSPPSGGAVRVVRGDFAVDLLEDAGAVRAVSPAGILMGNEIGAYLTKQLRFASPSVNKR